MFHHHCALDVQASLDSDGASDTTLEELQSPYFAGEPLTRMVKFVCLDTPSSRNSDLNEKPQKHFVRDEEINYLKEDGYLLDLQLNSGEDSEEDSQLCTLNLEYACSVLNQLTANPSAPCLLKVSLNSTPADPSHPLLVMRIDSPRELALWRFLNSPSLRRDPWNPSPPALIFERGLSAFAEEQLQHDVGGRENDAYIVMDHLRSVNDNPIKNTTDVIDFSRQILQGLVFLHEHGIAQASFTFTDASGFESIKMDIGLAPSHIPFSRYEFPVKYYILNFTRAVLLQVHPLVSNPSFTARHRDDRRKIMALVAPNSQILRPRPAPYILITDLSAEVPVSFSALREGRICSGSDISLMTPASCTPPDCILDVQTLRQPYFFTPQNSPQGLPEPEETDDTSEGEEEEGLWTVCAATRAHLFATDLNNVANLLQEAAVGSPAREALTPIISAMRRAKALSLSAEDALRMFERAVLPPVGMSMK